jgi:hypothetical protein
LIFIEKLSPRVIDDLVRELSDFEWIKKIGERSLLFILTEKGEKVRKSFISNTAQYIEQLTFQMQKIYAIPGWFVNRLWDLNPEGQGEIALPAPLRKWNPESRGMGNKKWDDELGDQALEPVRLINKICNGAFPVEETLWIKEVQNAWNRLSNIPPRKVSKIPAVQKNSQVEKGKIEFYAPRRRLFNAMKEAAVKLLFGNRNPRTGHPDFESDNPPLSARIYMAWCPRLAELGLIFYSDFHPQIPGRIIFPVSVFKNAGHNSSFKILSEIQTPGNEFLYLHQPKFKGKEFTDYLFHEHQRLYSKVKSLYVSIMDVRDEVCRKLRISAELFDEFLKEAIDESTAHPFPYSISIETDIREDQGGSYQKLRRPVIINGKPYSLIAMTKIKNS